MHGSTSTAMFPRRGWVGCLPALLLVAALAPAARAQNPAASLAGADTSETSAKAKGLPWIAHSSVDAFYLQSPAATGGSQPYQVSTYQGFTIQSLSFASFHAGWRFRETLAQGLTEPFREVFALKLMGTVEILRDYLFFSLGGSIPLVDGKVAESDTLALQKTLSEYSPLPAPNYITPQGLQVAVFGRYRLAAWDLMAGVAYSQPTQFEPVPGHPFHPASQLGGTFRAVLETDKSRHRFDAKGSRYGEEQTVTETPAHQEGAMYQARYAWLRSSARTAWQLGLGGAVKAPDANRQKRLRTALEPSEANDNVQRAYAEAAWTWSPSASQLWRVWLLPKALLEGSTRETGHETELGVTMGRRLWDVHRLRVGGTFLAGSFKGEDYLGFGLRAEFAFRHLGFQDLESQPEAGGEGN